jgi:hypothetical protein
VLDLYAIDLQYIRIGHQCIECRLYNGSSYISQQLELNPQSEIGFNDLFSAIRPVTLHVSSNDGKNQVTIKYKPKVSTVSFWNIETTDGNCKYPQ